MLKNTWCTIIEIQMFFFKRPNCQVYTVLASTLVGGQVAGMVSIKKTRQEERKSRIKAVLPRDTKLTHNKMTEHQHSSD